MPRQITSAKQFDQLKPKALECRVVRSDKGVKLKLRTPTLLCTYLAAPDEAEDLIKALKGIEVVDFSAVKREEKDTGKKKEKPEESD